MHFRIRWIVAQFRPWILEPIELFGRNRCTFASHLPIWPVALTLRAIDLAEPRRELAACGDEQANRAQTEAAFRQLPASADRRLQIWNAFPVSSCLD